MKKPYSVIVCRLAASLLMVMFLWTPDRLMAQVPFSETFTNSVLQPGWSYVSPNPSSTSNLTGSAFQMVASHENDGCDLWGSNFNAPRLMQPINPRLDWTLETSFTFSPGNNYQGAGILLADSNGVFTSSTKINRIAERAYNPGSGGPVIRSVGSYTAYSGPVSHFRLKKEGTVYTGWWSSNGVSWQAGGTVTNTDAWTYIGLFVIRKPWDGVPVNSDVSFTAFEIDLVQPPLTLEADASQQVVLSWPVDENSFSVYSATNLLESNAWTAVTGSHPVTNGSSVFWTNQMPGNVRHFRLQTSTPP